MGHGRWGEGGTTGTPVSNLRKQVEDESITGIGNAAGQSGETDVEMIF